MNEQALQAYKELVEKQAFVEDYFSKEIKISLKLPSINKHEASKGIY